MNKTQYVKDLKDKDSVSSPFLIKFSAVAVGKNGKPYMNLILMDNTGEIEARLWEDVQTHMGQAVKDSFAGIEGRCQVYQGRRQIVVNRLQTLREDEVNPKEYIAEGTLDAEALYSKLLATIDSMTDPHYRALMEAIFKKDPDIVDRMKRAPAAKTVHHAYKAGLLEHVVSMTEVLDHLAGHYAKYLNRDLLLTGALLHDIGKLWELTYDRVVDYTTEGKLVGHLVMGVELVNRKILELGADGASGAFPEEKAFLVKHLVLAHHGQLEFGSPKRPKCMEALVLHMIDDMDSKLNAIGSFIEQDQTIGQWTALNRQYERFFFKPEGAQPKSQINA